MSVAEYAFTTLTSATIVAFLLSAAIFMGKNLVIERLKQSVAAEYARELESLKSDHQKSIERLKAELVAQQAIQAVATASMTAAHVAGHEKVLAAVQTLWLEIVRVRTSLPEHIELADSLDPGELERRIANDATLRTSIEQRPTLALMPTMTGDDLKVAEARVFIGEYLFSLYLAYRAYIARVAFAIWRAYRANDLSYWRSDGIAERVLIDIWDDEEKASIPAVTDKGHVRGVLNRIERKMLEHAARIISGEASATFGLDQARRIARAATQELS